MAVRNTYIGDRRLKALIMNAAEAGVKETAGEVLDQAVQDAPILNSDLKESGQMDPPIKTANGITIYITFGNESVPYAKKQHEETTFNHPRGGKAKYLEDAVKMHTHELKKSIEKQLGKLGGF